MRNKTGVPRTLSDSAALAAQSNVPIHSTMVAATNALLDVSKWGSLPAWPLNKKIWLRYAFR
jgi:hypothetical protein